MTEKKSKKIFAEDLSVFEKSETVEVQKPQKKPRRTTQTSRELSVLIRNLQALGFKITPPTSAEDVQKHESAIEKLGLVSQKKQKVSKAAAEPSTITFTLGAQHVIAGHVYGPGELSLPREESDLARTLMHQDQLCMQAHMDTVQYNPFSKCFLIRPGNGADHHNKYMKKEVSAAQLVSATDNANDFSSISVTAGAMDIAGYNPNFIMENRTF